MLKTKSFSWTAVLLAAIMLLSLTLAPRAVHAEENEDFLFYTTGNGVKVTAGDSVSFELYAYMEKDSDLTLSIEDLPEGFTAFFKHGSYEISGIHVTAENRDALCTLQAAIPAETQDGTYTMTVKAVAETGEKKELKLTVNVNSIQAGDSNFSVEFPEQEGTSGTAFTYTATLANNTLNTQTYNFVTNAPNGWTVTYTADSTQVSSLEVESGSSSSVKITVTPPQLIEAGEYQIDCAAVSAKENLTNTLKTTILGTYGLDITTVDEKLSMDMIANEPSTVSFKVTNSGTMDLDNISIKASLPSDWTVELDKNIIESLAAGDSTEVKAVITPAKDCLTGDYAASITASTSNQTANVALRFTIKTATTWGIIAILIIICAAVILILVRKHFGRR